MLDLVKDPRAAHLRLIATTTAIALIVLAVLSLRGARYIAAFPYIFSSKAVAPFFENLPYTLELIGVSALSASIVGFLYARFSIQVWKPVTSALALVLQSIPFFWLAITMQLFLGVSGRLPTAGFSSTEHFSLTDHIWHLILPAGALTLLQLPAIVECFNEPLLDCTSHRGAESSILAALAMQFARNLPDIITATIITEIIFAWPGVGRLFWESTVRNGTASELAGFLLFLALFVLVTCFIVERVTRSAHDETSNV